MLAFTWLGHCILGGTRGQVQVEEDVDAGHDRDGVHCDQATLVVGTAAGKTPAQASSSSSSSSISSSSSSSSRSSIRSIRSLAIRSSKVLSTTWPS